MTEASRFHDDDIDLFELFASRVNDLKRALALPNTQPTELMQAIYVTPKPVSPKKALMLAIGVLLGGMLGVRMSIGARKLN